MDIKEWLKSWLEGRFKGKKKPADVHLRREGKAYRLEIDNKTYRLSDCYCIGGKLAEKCPDGATVVYVHVLGSERPSPEDVAKIMVAYQRRCPGKPFQYEGLEQPERTKSGRARVSGLENLDNNPNRH